MELKLTKPIVFFDLETTGINIGNDRIVEISMLKIFPNGNKESNTWLVNPEIEIPAEASAIHGITNEKVANETAFNTTFTDKTASFSGASDLLVNADISFLKEWKKTERNLMATVAFSTYSDKIYAIGTQGRGNIVEKSIGSLDFIIKSKLTKNLGIGLSAKNLLNPDFKMVQENPNSDITIQSFKKGINTSLSLNYKF